MNPKYLRRDSSLSGWGEGSGPWGARQAPGWTAGTLSQHACLRPVPLRSYLLFFGWYPQKEMFFNWKKWLHLFPYRREKRRGWSSAREDTGWESGGRTGRGTPGCHLGLLGVISLDADLHAPHADL